MYEKDPLPIYIIPKDIKDSIEKDIVPGVFYKPLSPSTYKDYFAVLLYAEDYYIEVHQMIILYNGFMDIETYSVICWLNVNSRVTDDETSLPYMVKFN